MRQSLLEHRRVNKILHNPPFLRLLEMKESIARSRGGDATLYGRIGDVFGWTYLLTGLGIWLLSLFRRTKAG
jgi:hypothetical protein